MAASFGAAISADKGFVAAINHSDSPEYALPPLSMPTEAVAKHSPSTSSSTPANTPPERSSAASSPTGPGPPPPKVAESRRRPRAKEAAKEETTDGEEVLVRAAREAQKDAGETIAFFDPNVVSVLAALTLGSDVEPAADPPQRRQRAEPPPASPSPPPALAWPAEWGLAVDGPGEAAQERQFRFASERHRAVYEALVAAALRQLEAGELAGAPAAFLQALASGPALDSRLVITPGGQRDLRRALPLLRAATRSMAAEQLAVNHLVRSAVCGMMFFSRVSPWELVGACERAWRLVEALTPATGGVSAHLAFLPLEQAVQLSRLAVDVLEASSEEEPAAYAEALSQLGFRLLQSNQDDEACARLQQACALVARRRLAPCRAEVRALRGLAISHARRFMTDKAAEFAAKIYWLEDSRDPVDLHLKFGCLDSIKRIAGSQRDWPTEGRMLGALNRVVSRQLSRDDPDLENYEFLVASYYALDALYRGRYLDFLRYYSRAVRYVRERPAMFASPILDACGCHRGTPLPARSGAAGTRLACRMQRIMDWRGATPLLAHLAFTQAEEEEKCGEAAKAAATYREALKEYERFPAVFPADHPRILAIRARLAALPSRSPPPDPNQGWPPDSPFCFF